MVHIITGESVYILIRCRRSRAPEAAQRLGTHILPSMLMKGTALTKLYGITRLGCTYAPGSGFTWHEKLY
jgi:hypothetical protein